MPIEVGLIHNGVVDHLVGYLVAFLGKVRDTWNEVVNLVLNAEFELAAPALLLLALLFCDRVLKLLIEEIGASEPDHLHER